MVSAAYAKLVHWRHILFLTPSGNDLHRSLQGCIWWRIWLESITLKAAMVISALLLQKLHPSSKAQKHVVCLKWWLDSSQIGDINKLIMRDTPYSTTELKQNHRHSLSARTWWTDATGKGQCCLSNLRKWEPLTQSWIHIQTNWPLPSVMSC